VLGSVGEPINPEAWHWYNEKVGFKQCAVVDTWWQTETGGILISPRAAHITTPKAGSATQPLPTIQPVILDNDGTVLEGEAEGNLCLADSWPAQARTLYGDHARFEQTYFSSFTGYYFSGDGCRRDSEGDYWITGRVDDVINVAGHRLGTAEIEAILDEAEEVVEAAVVGFPHDVKGQGIYAFVILHKEYAPSEALKKALVQQVREHLSPIATPDKIQFCNGLPKTRSGKIMRRILRKIAAGETDSLGDISTLADPSVVAEIIAGK
jgi:acetyl-CoA synthetase